MCTSLGACKSGKETKNTGNESDKAPVSETEKETEEQSNSQESVEAGITVLPVEGLSENFIMGVDISSLIAVEESGAVYYDENGEEADLLQILKDSGVNCVRLRVWNNPFDNAGNTYGAGTCDIDTVVEIGKRATEYGMGVLIDFHYSDFWADPNKQRYEWGNRRNPCVQASGSGSRCNKSY